MRSAGTTSAPPDLRRRIGQRRGTAAVEYALVTALIVIVCIGNLRLLGANSSRTFQAISRALESGSTGGFGPPQNSEVAPMPSTARASSQ